jgi:asparagine synthase (glutamine-hydrolysing)
MCGIAGIVNLENRPAPEIDLLCQMLEMIRHRGPDGTGVYRDEFTALGNVRLSIIDVAGGDQPIGNEDGTLWIVYNGEVFNYVELRPELLARGHRFTTQSDTEVILHLFEELGPRCLERLNGQFAFAIWDTVNRRLFMARDRVGVRPLFYTIADQQLVFGSEIKAILGHPSVRAEIDPAALSQAFTYWSIQPPLTIFKNIRCLPPGHMLFVEDGQIEIKPYWSLEFCETPTDHRPENDILDEFEELFVDATCIRLRADVPVGAYLSGGLDSSLTSAIIRTKTQNRLETFSISFSDTNFDESPYQRQMAEFLGTDHKVVYCTQPDIGQVFPDVIWHAETPILRTAPAPLFLLSGLVRENGIKVVITGEGADEFFGGYDIFKEMVIRRFWARDSNSELRPLLFKRIYPDIVGMSQSAWTYRKLFFKKGLTDTSSPYYSHQLRWSNTSRLQRFLSQPVDFPNEIKDNIYLPPRFAYWPALSQAQYLEVSTFLSPYLLSSQGDRMSMGHSVEGRYPFLDHRVIEFGSSLPPDMKLKSLTEKWLLRQIGRKYLPQTIYSRPKRPYRAPIHLSFFGEKPPEYVHDLLTESQLEETGLFNAQPIMQLVKKAETNQALSELDEMALVGILSTQMVSHQFVKDFHRKYPPKGSERRVKVISRIE